MFKNAIVYRITSPIEAALDDLRDRLEAGRFVPCAATQPVAIGWTPPRGDDAGPLVESIGGQWLLRMMVETKVLPASVVNRRIDEQASQMERDTGRKPGKKQRREMKEDAVHALLPQAFTKRSAVAVWIDPARRVLLVDAGTQTRADDVVTLLVKAFDGLAVALVQTEISAVTAMAEWLTSFESPAGFSVDRECELKSADESKSVVRYAKHPLDIDEIRNHIGAGKLPTKVALTWRDRVSFVLNEAMQIKKITFLDVVFEGAPSSQDDGFDADAAIATGELRELIPDLLDALGGERLGLGLAPTPGAEAAATAAPTATEPALAA